MNKNTLVLVGLCGTLLLSATPARAQLNNQKIQQNMEQKVQQGANTQRETQTAASKAVQTQNASQAFGTIVSHQNELLVVDQNVLVGGRTMVVKNKFYLQKTSQVPSTLKLDPKTKVKIIFHNEPDGRRVIQEIAAP